MKVFQYHVIMLQAHFDGILKFIFRNELGRFDRGLKVINNDALAFLTFKG